jgi:hypothetical protein
MVLTLLPQILMLVVTLLTVFLDYYWGTDKRKNEFKRGRRRLLAAVLMAAALNLVASYFIEKNQERHRLELNTKIDALSNAQHTREHEMLKRLLSHVEREFDLNFGVIQAKGGTTFGLVTGMVDPGKEELAIELLKVQKFHALVPSLWGEDMTLLATHGKEGEKAHQALLHCYEVLKTTQERETDLLENIRREKRPNWKASYIRMLHGEYETFRTVLTQTARAMTPVMREFGLAKDAPGPGP